MKGLLPIEYSKKLLKNAAPLDLGESKENIEEFQKSRRCTLNKLLGLDEIARVTSVKKEICIEFDKDAEDLGCREIRFTFESEPEVFVPCHLFIPKTDCTAPLIMALHGHSTGMHVSAGRIKYAIDEATIKEQECDFARQAVKRGFSVITIEQRGFGERGGDEKGARCSEIAFRSMMMGRTLPGERVWDTRMALDRVIENFSDEVDTKRIICLGYSGGGTIGTYLSALDERIGMAVITSAICTFADSIGAMPHCACNYIPSIAKHFDMGEICQLIAPRKLAIISGKDDPIFPVTGAKVCADIAGVAYELYGKSENLVHKITDGAHKFYPKEVWEVIHNYVE